MTSPPAEPRDQKRGPSQLEIDRTLRASFDRMEAASRYRAWVLSLAEPALGQRVLEVGAGVGHYTADLLDRERVVALDVDEAYLEALEARLGRRPNLRTMAVAVETERLAPALVGEALDSALALNVLEHLDDDAAALRNLARALRPGSAIVVQVPAHRWLFGEADRALGHRRRYDATSLRRALVRSGLIIERLWQFNALGVPGWLVSGRLRRRTMFSAGQLRVYEALVPLLRRLEPASGVPLGLSLMAWARTPASSG